MSGIYGMVRLDGAPVTRAMLEPVAAAMAGWGPDGHGQWCSENAGLGFLSLRITPESLHERLPMSLRAAPHLFITADARIDNRDELFNALQVPSAGRARTPDSSLILLAWERWGADCVKRLLGDFAFSIWDARQRSLFCARDPLGCRPLFYYRDARTFLFASDIKGTLAGVDSPRLNEPLLAAHLQMRTYYAQKTRTFYENILKLPAGHTLTLYGGELRLHEYWSPHNIPTRPPARDGELRELFRQAVECRVRSAFPVAAHLSGGIDSSAVTLQAARILRPQGRQLATFSWSPPPDRVTPRTSEYARIDAVCRQEGLRCEYFPVTAATLLRVLKRDFTIEPTELMPREENVQIRAQALGVRTILSGWGGDDAVTCVWPPGSAATHRSPIARLRASLLRHLPDSIYARVGPNPEMRYTSPCIHPEFERRYHDEVAQMHGPPLRLLATLKSTIARSLDIGHLPLRMEHWAMSGARRAIVY
ncbi:MAG TPA: asparagine synthase-related protein, partial [Bryobacteraceae bacterium]|nr:asparagine synthase-related protein [Bryobacteraceae bacterium]